LRSASGSAASEEAVEKATRNGSFTASTKRRTGTLKKRAIGKSTNSANTINETYSVRTSAPRLARTPSPLLPTVVAIAPPMPSGANFMITL
jgi:hypothetical protein